ncbi:MAG: flavodoxin family protein [Crenarchaeota archaeon]|nr:flavodoxin family protein [Thermoproteota archaeon]
MASVKVLGILGSPRKNGETYKLLRVALHAAEKMGAETRLVRLYDYNIKPCIGCVSEDVKKCKYPCDILGDDFPQLAKMVLESDALIFATPIYWYMASGVMKNFIDRLTCFENMIHHTGRSLLEGKVAAFIAVGNDTGAIMAISWLMVTLNSMGAHIPPWALAYYHRPEGDVLSEENALLDAANIGKIVVQAARLLKNAGEWYDAGLKKLVEEAVSELRGRA